MFYLIDAAPVLLWTASAGRVCLWTPEAWMQLDVGLDCFLCRSYDPGENVKKTFNWSFKGAMQGDFSRLDVVVLHPTSTA